jgi:hypothetical protein
MNDLVWLILTATKEETTEGADSLVIFTEWKCFMAPNFDQLAAGTPCRAQ